MKRRKLTPIAKKEKDKSCDLSSLVGFQIEISNCFIKDYESVIRFMKWFDAR